MKASKLLACRNFSGGGPAVPAGKTRGGARWMLRLPWRRAHASAASGPAAPRRSFPKRTPATGGNETRLLAYQPVVLHPHRGPPADDHSERQDEEQRASLRRRNALTDVTAQGEAH